MEGAAFNQSKSFGSVAESCLVILRPLSLRGESASFSRKPAEGLAEKENDFEIASHASEMPETAELGSASESEFHAGECGARLAPDVCTEGAARADRWRCIGAALRETVGIWIGVTLAIRAMRRFLACGEFESSSIELPDTLPFR